MFRFTELNDEGGRIPSLQEIEDFEHGMTDRLGFQMDLRTMLGLALIWGLVSVSNNPSLSDFVNSGIR